MILKSIKLDNIRSYVSESISFPEGSLMLSGDIGSGKSTILLAVEFALFGIRSDLNGESLLRHGRGQGSVELNLRVSGKDITVKRGLKRTSKSVQQETGHIIIDGIKKDLTAVELKTRVLDLLGYPKELVSKSKSLVYRYTVYTPQEEMKQILFDEKEERLNTLRRVFGIDRYRRIIENTTIVTKQLKSRTRELAGSIYDLEEKKALAAERRSELKNAEQEIKDISPSLEKARSELVRMRESMQRHEKDIKELHELKARLSASEAKLKEKLAAFQKNSKELLAIDCQIKELETVIKGSPQLKKPDIAMRRSILERKEALEKELHAIKLKINELELTKKNSAAVKDKISKLSSCPTCLQNVPHEHKKSIFGREDDVEKRCAMDMQKLREELSEKDRKIKEISAENERIIDEEKRYEKLNAQAEMNARLLKDKEERKKSFSALNEQITNDIEAINTEKTGINNRMSGLSASEENYQRDKRLFDELREKEKQLELKKVSFEKEAEGIRRIISSFEKEISEKEKAKENIARLKELQDWLDNNFVNLIAVIEKHIMAKVYEEFNALFQQWFRVMIEDEALSVSLDHDFTPIAQQDGYETFVEYLSGGEKTAIALAYRLSLNKVINDMIGAIKTKDIIILDEPTDGFSSEQLDKLREVIEQLEMKQVIIVSHEPKIEGFVDSILRVEKRGHVSSVMS